MKKILLGLLCLLICMIASCKEADKTIKVGASATPHALILEQTREYIESKGYKLEIVVFDDYVLPNLALENNELDANYFQHVPYLEEFNKENNTHLISAYAVHYEPMGIFQGSNKNGKIAVPSDYSNNVRAKNLLDQYEITGELIETEAQYLPLILEDCEYAVINGNYALASGILEKGLFFETSDNGMANVIACKEKNEKVDLLIEALQQPNIPKFIQEQFGSSVKYVGK